MAGHLPAPRGDLRRRCHPSIRRHTDHRRLNRPHKVAITGALVYITASVPLHIYVGLVLNDMDLYVRTAGFWFSYLLLIVVYPVFLTAFARLHYRN